MYVVGCLGSCEKTSKVKRCPMLIRLHAQLCSSPWSPQMSLEMVKATMYRKPSRGPSSRNLICVTPGFFSTLLRLPLDQIISENLSFFFVRPEFFWAWPEFFSSTDLSFFITGPEFFCCQTWHSEFVTKIWFFWVNCSISYIFTNFTYYLKQSFQDMAVKRSFFILLKRNQVS